MFLQEVETAALDAPATWSALSSLLESHCKERSLLLTQEWPKKSSLWKKGTYLRAKTRLGLTTEESWTAVPST